MSGPGLLTARAPLRRGTVAAGSAAGLGARGALPRPGVVVLIKNYAPPLIHLL